MADCELLATCPFFHDMIPNQPIVTEGMKALYCQGENSECARYQIAKAIGREHVPFNLFPNETEQAKWIIERGQSSS